MKPRVRKIDGEWRLERQYGFARPEVIRFSSFEQFRRTIIRQKPTGGAAALNTERSQW